MRHPAGTRVDRRTPYEAAEPDQGRHSSRPQGVWLRPYLPSPWVIDILGKLDFDYVFIDGEHGPFDLERLEELCRAAERYNLTTFAHVPDIGSSTILRYLDRGIMGILGPHIATEADARQLVWACYLGPLGERSFGGNRGTDYNAGIPAKVAYFREANEQMCWFAPCWKTRPC
jgi:2-keto-3-deoxy-L-rhamnonate aldolase RhmA